MTAQVRPDELIRILRAEFVTKSGGVPGGGGSCVVHTCGATGWRATGGTIARTLVHEVAFQLDTGGNARGVYAIDLQQDRGLATEVAAADYSVIIGNPRNEIHPDASYSIVIGNWNKIYHTLGGAAPSTIFVFGDSNEIESDSYALSVLGQAHDIQRSNYGSYFGYNHDIDAFGCYSLIEANDIVSNVNDQPTYSGSIGILNLIEGDVFDSYQFGENNAMIGLGIGGWDSVWACFQVGYNNYMGEQADNVWQFGRSLCSYLPAGLAGDFYNGRFIANGDNPQEFSTNTPESTGFNQNSWFNQDTAINTWTVAWISSRFQFPIIEDSIWYFEAHIAGTELGCANSYAWKIEGVVENDGGTTTIKTSTVTNVYRDVATKEWQVVTDDPNDRLVFQFRDTGGPDATRCNIQFSMHTVEVGYEF